MADRDDRSRARAHWPVRLTRLTDVETHGSGTPDERLAIMWELVVEAWAIAGRTIPEYARKDAPVRIVRLGEDA